VGQILDALLGAVAAINADTGIGVGNRAALDVGILGHFSIRHCQCGEICATKPEEAFQTQQILARLQLSPAFQSQSAKRYNEAL
jgi:hypothetical protein